MGNEILDKVEKTEETLTDRTFCLPVYNVSQYIGICVDDCSTDDSWQILNKICAQNNSCFCFKNDSNRGVSYTRNCTLELAKEKYIWFIDPDDLLCPLGGGWG